MRCPAVTSLIGLTRKTPLQEQVAALRVCPKCHKRTLVEAGMHKQSRCVQCTNCLALAVLPAGPFTGEEQAGGA